MARLFPIAACLALIFAAGCGSTGVGGGGYGGNGGMNPYHTPPPGSGAIDCSVAPAMGAVTIDVNLGLASCNDKTYGVVLGYSNDNVSSHVVKLHVGSTVVFKNTGTVPHTADDLGKAGFPASDTVPLAQAAAGTDISTTNFSTGALSVGASSPVYNVGVAGIYFFGCNFHYGMGMRTVLIVS